MILTVLGSERRGRRLYWRCRCVCGVEKAIRADAITSGQVKSCGCLSRKQTSERAYRHGLAGTLAYKAWAAMLTRCYNPAHLTFPNYGGRGISVFARWHSVENFVADMGQPARGLQLDRINGDGNYEPGNCRWVTARENSNNRRNTRFVMWEGERVPLAQWCRIHGKNFGLVSLRLQRGWSEQDALTRAPNSRKGKSWC